MFSNAVKLSLKEEIKRELEDGEFNRGKLRRLKKMIAAAEQFMMLDTPTAPEVLDGDDIEVGNPGGGLVAYGGVLGGGVNPENIQARMMREIIDLLPSLVQAQKETPANMVAAIAEAERTGQHEVAAALRRRLIGAPVPADARLTAQLTEGAPAGAPAPGGPDPVGVQVPHAFEPDTLHPDNAETCILCDLPRLAGVHQQALGG